MMMAKSIHPRLAYWRHRLTALHRYNFSDWIIALLISIYVVGFHGLMVLHTAFDQHYQIVTEFDKTNTFFSFQEKRTLDLADSPFQLVTYQQVDLEQLQASFSHLPQLHFLPAIETWFPTVYEFEGEVFQIMFMDLPFQQEQITTAWIGLTNDHPKVLSLSTMGESLALLPLSITKPLVVLNNRPQASWFEPKQLHLSYWQWWNWLQEETVYIEDEVRPYAQWLLDLAPPNYLRLYSQDVNTLKIIKQLDVSTTAWTITGLTNSQIEQTQLWLPIAVWFVRLMLLAMTALYAMTWWTQFIHLHRRYHQEVIWFNHLGIRYEKTFVILSQRWMIWIQGFEYSLAVGLAGLIHWLKILPLQTLVMIAAHGLMMTSGLIVLARLLQKMFPYA
jgi:hypothetical protein